MVRCEKSGSLKAAGFLLLRGYGFDFIYIFRTDDYSFSRCGFFLNQLFICAETTL